MPAAVYITNLDGQRTYGIFASQSIDPASGDVVLLLINISKHQLRASLQLTSRRIKNVANMITSQSESNTLTLAPRDVYLLHLHGAISQEKSSSGKDG